MEQTVSYVIIKVADVRNVDWEATSIINLYASIVYLTVSPVHPSMIAFNAKLAELTSLVNVWSVQ